MAELKISHNKVEQAIAIMQQVAAWGRSKGFADIWPHERLTRQRLITPEAQPIHFCTGELDGQTVCAFILQESDSSIWPDAKEGESLYLHKFCVLREHAHRGITKKLMDAIGEECRLTGKQYIRLDAVAQAKAVRDIYIAAGFQFVKELDVPGDCSLALYELAV